MSIGSWVRRTPGATSVTSAVARSCSWRRGRSLIQRQYRPGVRSCRGRRGRVTHGRRQQRRDCGRVVGPVHRRVDRRLAAAVVDPRACRPGRRDRGADRRRRAGARRGRRAPAPPAAARRPAAPGRRARRRRRPLDRRHGRRRRVRSAPASSPAPDLPGGLGRQAPRLLDRRRAPRRRRRSCSSTPTSAPVRASSTGSRAAVAADPDAVTSVQPWHDARRARRAGRRRSANVVALMGSGAFTVARRPGADRPSPTDRCSPSTRAAYDARRRPRPPRRAGQPHRGHRAGPAASGAAGCSRAAADATFRMYPAGLRPVAGRVVADDGRRDLGHPVVGGPRRRGVGVVAGRGAVRRLGSPTRSARSRCGCSAAGPGRVGPVLAALYPLARRCVLVVIVVRAGVDRVRGTTTWKGRAVDGGVISGRRAGSCRRWRRPPCGDGPRRPRRAGTGGRSPAAASPVREQRQHLVGEAAADRLLLLRRPAAQHGADPARPAWPAAARG